MIFGGFFCVCFVVMCKMWHSLISNMVLWVRMSSAFFCYICMWWMKWDGNATKWMKYARTDCLVCIDVVNKKHQQASPIQFVFKHISDSVPKMAYLCCYVPHKLDSKVFFALGFLPIQWSHIRYTWNHPHHGFEIAAHTTELLIDSNKRSRFHMNKTDAQYKTKRKDFQYWIECVSVSSRSVKQQQHEL